VVPEQDSMERIACRQRTAQPDKDKHGVIASFIYIGLIGIFKQQSLFRP
jgi:hypothetical protein